MKRLPPRLEQVVIAVALCAAFLMMASIFAPDPITADPGIDAPAEPTTDPHEGLPSLGSIEDGRYIVRIFGGENGPFYSIYDAEDGTELGVLLTAEKAAEWFPDLPIPDMDFGTESPIMLAEPVYMSDH